MRPYLPSSVCLCNSKPKPGLTVGTSLRTSPGGSRAGAVNRIPYIPPHGCKRLSILHQWDPNLYLQCVGVQHYVHSGVGNSAISCVQAACVSQRSLFLLGSTHENVPATGRSILFHPNMVPERSGWWGLIWFIMSSWPLASVLALKEMGNQWIWGGCGSTLVPAVANGEYEHKKSHF